MEQVQDKPVVLTKASRAVGRPPRVDAHAILEAAIEIGLEQVTMKAVADRLEVGISTLYQHVKNRSELVRLAALRQALTRRPREDAGQHWAELAVGYAEDLLDNLISEPQLLVELLKGGLGPRMEVDVLEHFLQAMSAHGFSAEEGVRLYRKIGMVALGGAVATLSVRTSRAAGAAHSTEIRRILAERAEDELPQIRSAAVEYQREDEQVWLDTLLGVLTAVALERRETLPVSLVQARRPQGPHSIEPAGMPESAPPAAASLIKARSGGK